MSLNRRTNHAMDNTYPRPKPPTNRTPTTLLTTYANIPKRTRTHIPHKAPTDPPRHTRSHRIQHRDQPDKRRAQIAARIQPTRTTVPNLSFLMNELHTLMVQAPQNEAADPLGRPTEEQSTQTPSYPPDQRTRPRDNLPTPSLQNYATPSKPHRTEAA